VTRRHIPIADYVERNLLINRAMPVPFPHHYQAWLVRTLSSRARIEAPPRPQITAGPPPEFDGDATAWSAEQLILSALGMGVLTTFEAFAAREKVTVLAWQARVGGTVTRTETGLRFSKYIVEVDMEVNDVDRAREALEQTKAHCLIANALVAPVEIEATIHLPARKAS
jgi:organic hydroperoxide reductase OsmC/OhrA